MTRSELIRKISKRAGVPDSETKVFFEIFLKRLASVLKTGQAFYLSGFGYLYLLQGKIIKSEQETEYEKTKPEIIDLFYYSSEKLKDNKLFDGWFFIVPVPEEDDFNAVDAAFSLSFGKPLIPFKGVVDTDFFIPHTGSELRRLIESKVDKIIENSEFTVVSDFLESVIDLDEILFSKAKEQSVEPPVVLSFEELLSDKDIEKQIEEDSIIDLAEVDDSKTEKRKPLLSWDFDSFDSIGILEKKSKTDFDKIPKKESNDQAEEESVLTSEKKDSTSNQEIDVNISAEESIKGIEEIISSPKSERKSDKEVEETFYDITDESEPPVPYEKFERVKTLTDVFENTEQSSNIKSILSGKDKIEIEDNKTSQPDEIIKEPEFIEINTALRLSTEKREKEQEKVEKVIKPIVAEVKYDKGTFEEDKERFKQRRKSRSSSVIPFIMLAISIAIIGFGVYYYLAHIKSSDSKQEENRVISFNTDGMKIIERDFDFPVSYPYPKRTERAEDVAAIFDIKKEQVTETVPEVAVVTAQEVPPAPLTEEPKPIVNNQPPPGIEKRIGVNLFQYNDVYVVQVAAFRSSSVAENEAGRFRNKGYNAFVERAEVDGSFWHRVKVGNFTDLEEAKRFAVQFK